MSNTVRVTHSMVEQEASRLATLITEVHTGVPRIYPIPRGGVPVAYMISKHIQVEIVSSPAEAEFFVDDIVDSGSTMERYCDQYPGVPFLALYDKVSNTHPGIFNHWLQFPWEGEDPASGIEDNIVRLLQYVGEEADRGGLLETPKRVAKAWDFWTQGYDQKPEDVLKTFEDGGEGCDEMVVVKDIPFYSHCEHHMAPFFGTATIAYIPNGKIVGLSKLSRLLNVYARRLQVQERLTNQVATALMEHLNPLGAGVMIKARHMCMESRGVCQQGHHTVTSALRGVIKDQPDTRAEFISIAK